MPWPRLTFAPANLEARRKLTAEERRIDADAVLKFRTNLAILIAVILGVALAVWHGGAVTVSVAVFAAAVGLGGVLGFLFGVPGAAKPPVTIGNVENVAIGTGDRSKAISGNAVSPPLPPAPAGISTDPDSGGGTAMGQPSEGIVAPLRADATEEATPAAAPGAGVVSDEGGPPPPSPWSVPPSNLEQVADWVTKLLLGGGLTQMQRIPPKVWQWSRSAAIGILRDTQNPSEALIQSHQAFAAGLMVYGFILGFFAGFLITKLQLGKAISS